MLRVLPRKLAGPKILLPRSLRATRTAPWPHTHLAAHAPCRRDDANAALGPPVHRLDTKETHRARLPLHRPGRAPRRRRRAATARWLERCATRPPSCDRPEAQT